MVFAAQYYQVGNTTTVTVNEWSTCSKVTNNCGPAIFVPTNTSAEWSTFITNKPACIGLGSCAVPVNCSYTTYQWGSCSASCGGGNRDTYYTKTVVESWGGTCPITEGQWAGWIGASCNTQACPVNGWWSAWGPDYGDYVCTEWGWCGEPSWCSQWYYIRTRSCNSPAPANGWLDCVWPSTEPTGTTGYDAC